MTLRERLTQTVAKVFVRILAWIQAIFAPKGNLLVRDLLAEVSMHIASDGVRRTSYSKFEGPVAHHVVQGLVHSGVEFAAANNISINWVAMNHMLPYQGVNPCAVCGQPIQPNEPFVMVCNPPKVGHLRCVVTVEEK
jgi:hypothetical protein